MNAMIPMVIPMSTRTVCAPLDGSCPSGGRCGLLTARRAAPLHEAVDAGLVVLHPEHGRTTRRLDMIVQSLGMARFATVAEPFGGRVACSRRA